MANRIIRTMPVWGLSALAAGSISASLSDSGQAEVSPRAAPALANDTPWQASSKLLPMTPSAQPQFVRNSGRPAEKAVEAYGMNIDFMHKGWLADRPGHESSLANTAIGKAPVTTSATIAAVKAATVIGLPASATVANGRAIGIVDVLQVAATNAPKNVMAAGSVALPKISSDHPATETGLANGRAIYGTSANNAYKVYFPQSELAASAKGSDFVDGSASSAEYDSRVLTKHGSYLFYEDQAEQTATGKIKEILKTNGAGSGDIVADAIANMGKNGEVKELTAPVLQKQPLNFGDRSLEGAPPKGNAAPSIPNGQSNAG